MKKQAIISPQLGEDLISFYREGVQTRSYSDEEGAYAKLILKEMENLSFDDAYIDPVGNVVGKMGTGSKIIHFDSHMDTVQVNDEKEWISPPFEAALIDGKVYGRGTVDMKGGLSASIYAVLIARECGLLENKTVYVTGSVCEEYCDGVCLEHFYRDSGIKPDYCVICEPSNNVITLGHNGKVQARIKTHGVSAHGSAPEKGINAVYEMAEIITRVETLNKSLSQILGGGTIVLSNIQAVTASLNAVPSECEIYLDRRLRLGETTTQVTKELDLLIEGKRATWEYGTLHHTSWNGVELVYKPIHEPWKISENHELTMKTNDAFEAVYGVKPSNYDFWDFGTNAVIPVHMGVPTIGFGPGEYKLAHMRDECCSIDQVKEAALFYAELIGLL